MAVTRWIGASPSRTKLTWLLQFSKVRSYIINCTWLIVNYFLLRVSRSCRRTWVSNIHDLCLMISWLLIINYLKLCIHMAFPRWQFTHPRRWRRKYSTRVHIQKHEKHHSQVSSVLVSFNITIMMKFSVRFHMEKIHQGCHEQGILMFIFPDREDTGKLSKILESCSHIGNPFPTQGKFSSFTNVMLGCFTDLLTFVGELRNGMRLLWLQFLGDY